jgi:hypothetical protein
MKVKLTKGELKDILKEEVKYNANLGLDAFKNSPDFKSVIEDVIIAMKGFSNTTPVGFFELVKQRYEIDLYKTFSEFNDNLKDTYNNLYGDVFKREKIKQSIEDNKVGE